MILPVAESCRRGGFTLLEMVTVFGALTLCMVLGAMLIMTTLKAERLGQNVGNQISVRKQLARQFREDVSRAESAPEKLGNETAGPRKLILQMPGKSAVVYLWEKDKLQRVERADNKETTRPVPVGPEGTTIEFARSPDGAGSHAGLITMRLTETPQRGLPKKSEISAALGRSLK